MANNQEIVIYHSPDADDAFMFYGLQCGAVQVPGFTFRHELCDIETLNHRTLRGELDVTAASVHAYAHLFSNYAVLRCGASMGGVDYGPCLIANSSFDLADGKRRTIAIPGQYTSAALALKIWLRENSIEADLPIIFFDKVQDAVRSGEVDAGVIIHEGQLTHQREGFTHLLDLGAWWWKKTSLPLPLGVNLVRKALGQAAMAATYQALRESIEYSLAHREEALTYALSYGRGLSRKDADRFVAMYVNERTRDIGEEGMRSIEQFLALGAEYGFVPRDVRPAFVPESR
jgi:1,4-dihydroxy-6-naphthoate synthase